jgi:uncharacterized protein YjbI with pentapeptide repeats
LSYSINLQKINTDGYVAFSMSPADLLGLLKASRISEFNKYVEQNKPSLNFDGVDLSQAILGGVDLRGVSLSGANLYHANLSRADLRGAILRGANLSRANLYCADLAKTDLTDANLTDANLIGANLDRAIR